MVFVVFWLAFAVVAGIAASGRGRSGLGWFFLGLVFGVFALIAVLVMQPVGATRGDTAPSGAPGKVSAARLPSARPGARPVRLSPMHLDEPDDDAFDVQIDGTSKRQDALRGAHDGHLPQRVWVRLDPEPQNPADRNAVRVSVQESVVGYLPRGTAKAIAEMPPAWRTRIFEASHPAMILGGYTDDLGDSVPLGLRLMVRGL